jgi:nucleoside-diphosphate-sugar epimerase
MPVAPITTGLKRGSLLLSSRATKADPQSSPEPQSLFGHGRRPSPNWPGRCRLAIPLHPQAREGELAVKAAFTDVILFRPAVMFGPDDAFLTTILELLRRLPIYPMFGRGRTRLQPAYVEDVAEAIARAPQRTQTHAITFECGGPRVYSYEELLRALAREADLERILIPLPFAAWRAPAWTAELLPNPPVTPRLPSSARRPKLMVITELRKRLVISGWFEQRQEAPHYGVNRPGCVPNVKVDRIEQVP